MSVLNDRIGFDHHEAMAPVFESEVQALRRELESKNQEIKRLKLQIRRNASDYKQPVDDKIKHKRC